MILSPSNVLLPLTLTPPSSLGAVVSPAVVAAREAGEREEEVEGREKREEEEEEEEGEV